MPFTPFGRLGDPIGLGRPFKVKWSNVLGGIITAVELIVAGGTEGVIRSQNYDGSSTGWALFGDGSSAFFGSRLGMGMWYRGTAQTIPNTTNTTLAATTVGFVDDPNSDFSISSGVITINNAGVYRVTGGVAWASDADGSRLIYIMKNGSTSLANRLAGSRILPVSFPEQSISALHEFAAADTVEMNLYHNAGDDLDTRTGPGSHISIERVK